MRIGIISDIHIEYNLHHDFVKILAEICEEERLDYLVFAGDTSSGVEGAQAFYPALAARTDTVIRQIPGNHEQYVIKDADYIRPDTRIGEAAAAQEAAMLEDERFSLQLHPIETDDWLVFGAPGWYDYTFDLRRRTVKRAARLAQKKVGLTTWPDYHFVDGDVPSIEREFSKVDRDLAYLEKCFQQAKGDPARAGKRICAVTHMAPTRLLLRGGNIPFLRNHLIFLGSQRYAQLYERYGVTMSVSGHTHSRLRAEANGVRYAECCLGFYFQWKNKRDARSEIRTALIILEDEA